MDDFGFLLIDKPPGFTSFQIVKKIRYLTGIKKIGHTGTLDPFATGLLPICVGKATRLANFIVNDEKEYIVKAKFGILTETGDSSGKIVREKTPKHLEFSDLAATIPEILAIKKQIPPKYSALNVNGVKAYKLARENIDFYLAERDISILDFELSAFDLPYFSYRTIVSKGTYIRTLTEQIAALLGEIAVTTELRRTKIGKLVVENAINIDEIKYNNWREFLIPVENVLTQFETITLSREEVINYLHGKKFYKNLADQEFVLIKSHTDFFLGLGKIADKILYPTIVMR